MEIVYPGNLVLVNLLRSLLKTHECVEITVLEKLWHKKTSTARHKFVAEMLRVGFSDTLWCYNIAGPAMLVFRYDKEHKPFETHIPAPTLTIEV